MDNNLLMGKLTRLAALDPEKAGEWYAQYTRDSEFLQLFDSDPARPRAPKSTREWYEREMSRDKPGWFPFLILTLEDERMIGETMLMDALSPHASPWVAIGIPDREFWGRGYGTDAMNIVLRFAFQELNAHRVNLDTFEYNPRAMRSYEKAGFAREGNVRGGLLRYGRRWDMVVMGILREEWERKQREAH